MTATIMIDPPIFLQVDYDSPKLNEAESTSTRTSHGPWSASNLIRESHSFSLARVFRVVLLFLASAMDNLQLIQFNRKAHSTGQTTASTSNEMDTGLTELSGADVA